MKILIAIFIIQLNLFLVQSFLNQYLCKTSKEKNYCSGVYNFTCAFDKCSINKAVCEMFLKFRYEIVRKNVKNFATSLEKYKDLLQKIKNCPAEWQPNEVCLNKAKCNYLAFNNSTNKFNLKFKKCKCTGRYSIACEKYKICSVNRNVCEAFAFDMRKNKKNLDNIAFCPNMVILNYFYF